MKKVGKIKEAHGLKGELSVLIFSQDISWLSDLETCQIQNGSQIRELQVLAAKAFKKGFILKAKEITNRNESEAVEGWDFLIPEDLLISELGDTIFLNEVLHFKALDPAGKLLGEVIDFSSNGVQDLLILEKPDGKLAEIPFVPAFVKQILFEKSELILDLPEGLLDLEGLED